jgi:hypothetical protein
MTSNDATSSPADEYRDGYTERLPDELLLQELNRLAEKLGRTPTATEMKTQGEYSPGTYENHFGSWSTALREVGFEPIQEYQVPSEQILEEITRLASESGEPLTSAEMREQGQYSVTAAQNHFGSWNEALRAAGFNPRKRVQVPDEELLDEISRLTDELGKVPTAKEMSAHGEFSHKPYIRRWNGWQAAVRAAGYEPAGGLRARTITTGRSNQSTSGANTGTTGTSNDRKRWNATTTLAKHRAVSGRRRVTGRRSREGFTSIISAR